MSLFKRVILMLLVPTLAVGCAVTWYLWNSRYVDTDNAYVKSKSIVISPDIDGRVVSVAVQDHHQVFSGQLLFSLDRRPYQIQLERASAKLQSVKYTLQSMRAEYTQNVAQIAEANARVDYRKKEYQRQQDLVNKGVGAKATMDQTAHEWEQARQDLRVVRQRSRKVLATLGGDIDVAIEKHPMYLDAAAAIHDAELQLAYTEVRAPDEGIVTRMNLEGGEWVEKGRPVFYIVRTQELWIEANLKETQLTHVKVGQAVEARVDAYPDQVFTGTVARISPATGSEFMLLPAQNATGNWIKVVQRVPVRIELDVNPESAQIRAGMTVAVSIDTALDNVIISGIKNHISAVSE
jgi:membrane fusion protein, multidrug efflux system